MIGADENRDEQVHNIFMFFRYLQLPHPCAQAQTGNVASAQQFSGGTRHLLVLANTWGFSCNDDGISTVAREMAQHFVKDPQQVKVSYLAIDTTHDQQDEGHQVAGLSVEFWAGGYLTTHRRLPEILVEVIA